MWIWIMVFTLFIVLLIVFEEVCYYIWNLFLYGSKYGKKLKSNRMMTILTLCKKKLQVEIPQTKKEKSL
jgi:hypothetical protein